MLLASPPGASSSAVLDRAQLSGQEQGLLQAINHARAAHGRRPVRIAYRLHRAARSHSNAMLRTGAFTHGDWYGRLRRHGVQGRTFGENIAWGSGAAGAPAALVRMWLASPPHRATMLSPAFSRVGVGIARGTFSGVGDSSVATADFAG